VKKKPLSAHTIQHGFWRNRRYVRQTMCWPRQRGGTQEISICEILELEAWISIEVGYPCVSESHWSTPPDKSQAKALVYVLKTLFSLRLSLFFYQPKAQFSYTWNGPCFLGHFFRLVVCIANGNVINRRAGPGQHSVHLQSSSGSLAFGSWFLVGGPFPVPFL